MLEPDFARTCSSILQCLTKSTSVCYSVIIVNKNRYMNIYAQRVAIVGVTGYAGQELDRLLAAHPKFEVAGRFASKADEKSRAEGAVRCGGRSLPSAL